MKTFLRTPAWSLGATALSLLVAVAAGVVACSANEDDAGSSDAAISAEGSALLRTLNELAAFGEKRVGTPGGAQAASYVMQRMQAAGLQNVHFEEFNFPMHVADVPRSSFQVTQNGQPVIPIAFDVFEGSGNGRADNAPIVFVGSAKPGDLQGKDLHGKIAFVKRDNKFHRSSQYRNVAAAGAVAMLYMSEVPQNQIQIGSIREAWEAIGPIPTITIGQDDGNKLRCLLGERVSNGQGGGGGESGDNGGGQVQCSAGGEIRATIDVKATTAHGTGKNVIGVVPGKHFGEKDASGRSLDHQIVFGAHFDTWYIGSVDNGCGVAGLLSLAEKRARTGVVPEYTTVFVGFDGEEVGLYGGYDYLRRHQNEGMLAVVNLEQPSAEDDVKNVGLESLIAGVAKSEIAVIENVLRESEATGPFTAFAVAVSLDRVARSFGGIIPTDIQGIYRSGIPTISTASFSAWYHTRNDTPDKVDTTALARVVNTFGRTADRLMTKRVEDFRAIDSKLWTADVDLSTNGGQVTANVAIKNASGALLPNQRVKATFFCDDFFAAPDVAQTTDGQGRTLFTFPLESSCRGRRWVHVTAGPDIPLVEKALAVPANGQHSSTADAVLVSSGAPTSSSPGTPTTPAKPTGTVQEGGACAVNAASPLVMCAPGLRCDQPNPDSIGSCVR